MDKENEVSTIEVINDIKDFINELQSKWTIITISAVLFSLAGFVYTYLSKPVFKAKTTMMLETSSKGSSMSGALALANKFGFMSGGGNAEINEDKLIEIIPSVTILKNALFEKVTIDHNNDYLGNHFIDIFGFTQKWKEDDPDSLSGFRFTNAPDKMTLLEKRIFSIVYNKIIEHNLSRRKSESGIVSIVINSKSEAFSIFLNRKLIESLTNFYVDRITEKGRTNLKIIQKRVDSIAVKLEYSENELAKWKDANFQLVKAQGMMEEMNLRRKVEVNNSIYIEGIKQLEIAKFTLLQDTPFLQIIDSPTFPLKPIKTSPIKGLIVGFMVGIILSGGYVFVRKKYIDLMDAEKLTA